MLFVCLSAQLLPLKFTNSEFLEPPNPCRFQLRFTEIEWAQGSSFEADHDCINVAVLFLHENRRMMFTHDMLIYSHII